MPRFAACSGAPTAICASGAQCTGGTTKAASSTGFTPANRPELMTCVFNTYSRYLDTYARAAKQQWGSQGIWIPETTWFNGLEDLPGNIAAEMRDFIWQESPGTNAPRNLMSMPRTKTA